MFQNNPQDNLSLASRARTAFCAGDYVQAIKLYEQAIIAYPELARFYYFNLDLARKKLDLARVSKLRGPSIKSSIRPSEISAAKTVGLVMLEDLYREATEAAQLVPPVDVANTPLVSVLMTAHNIACYIEAAVTSVLRQTWQRLEVIVVDDASTDDTWTILQRLEKSDLRLRCRRLNTNLGTYFAKNHALTIARGDFIFFQDADDLSHPERIRLGMQILMQDDVVCVRGVHSRVTFPSGQVLPVNGRVKRPGFITLGLRRQVFDDIGFFNCTTKASDDEFVERMIAYTAQKGGKIRSLDVPLYYSGFRTESLFGDMIINDPVVDGSIKRHNSPSRAQYKVAFTSKHRQLGVDGFKKFFRYPVLRDLIPVASDMSYLVNPTIPVVASLCAIPERADSLREMLSSLAPQVDALHVYLDRYNAVPDFVQACHPRVATYLACDYPGLRDNGKFLAFTTLTKECYYFTADDDIFYPPDYVATMIRRIEHYGRQAVVGVHGVLVPEEADRYFTGYRKVLGFQQALERDALVNNLGTGTVAFHSALLQGLGLSDFCEPGMADLFLSIFCKQRQIPMIAIARPADWLQDLTPSSSSLYREFHKADNAQSALIRAHRPWGYKSIRQAVAGATARAKDAEVGVRLSTLVPDLHACLR